MTATVLIVDDSSFIVEGLTAILRKSYRPLPTFGGEECLAVLRTEKPDVIVLDIMMEPMDGWETLARIKENPATRHIPVLMFSAKKVSPEEAEAHRIGFDDFLTKPVSPHELIMAIEKILERDRQHKAIIYHWGNDGVSREKIDEYLTCSSNIEVDSSLLAAMKKQMGHPTTTPVQHDDLMVTIAMLEDRIEKGRVALDEFIRTSGLTLPSSSDIPAMIPRPGPSSSQDTPARTLETLPETRSPPHDLPGTPGDGSTGAGTPVVMHEIPLPPVSASRVPEPAAAGNEPHPIRGDIPVTGEGNTFGGTPAPSEDPVLPKTVPAPGAPDDSIAVPPRIMQEPAGEAHSDSGFIHLIAIPSYADPMQEKKIPVTAARVPASGAAQAVFGAGTSAEMPMPLMNRSGHRETPRKKEPVQPVDNEPKGFFARIIAMITGIFSRGKK
ncbi:MAG: response regulator [Methanoregula sp.]|nr:response regulator [Methanoregula sp.]